MSKKEQWIFLQKFGRLIDASLPADEAWHIAGKNIKDKKFFASVKAIESEIISGKSLNDAFSRQMNVWNQSTIALIRVGEISGTLSANLLRASENMRIQSERRGQMLSALFYPAIISVLALGIISFLLLFVYPKITPLFIGMKTQLPISTRIIMKGSEVMSRYWFWFLITPICIVGAFYYLMVEFEQVRLFIERFVMRIPIIGNVTTLSQLSDAAFIIGSLCQGGMSVSDSIGNAIKTLDFIAIKKCFEQMYFELVEGSMLSECVQRQKIFPPIWSDLIIVGERTGALPSALLNISLLERQEIDETMALLNKLIEPAMMILVGVIVGFIAMSIITPMYSLTQHVQEP